MAKNLTGVYRAVCLEVTEDRVRCKVPQIFAAETVTCFDVSGSRPAVGVQGFVAFESGWPDRPVWIGGQWEVAASGGGGGEGTPGAPGVRGSLWYEGSGAPGVIVGVRPNDMYLNNLNGDVYTRGSSAWTLTGNIRGPAGTPGATGPAGPAGVTDHGALIGLSDDDHPQYLRAAEVLAGANVTVDRTTTPGSVIIAATGAGGTTPPNEVVVSTTDPIVTYPEAELWFDPDAVIPPADFPGYGVVPAETTFGIAKADGVATTVARSDHTHGTPAHTAGTHSGFPLSALAAATSNVSLGGNLLTNVGAPAAGTDAANRDYVDGVALGVGSGYRLEERATATSTPIIATAAETTILSLTVDALVTGERIRLRSWGDLINSGATANLRLFLRFSSLVGTLIFDSANNSIVNDAARRPWLFELDIEASIPASDNDWLGRLAIGAAAPSTRIGTNLVNGVGVNPGVTLNLSSAFQLFLTGQWSSATSTDLRLHGYSIERFV